MNELNVDFLPVNTIIDGKKYRQHYDITTEEVYRQLIEEDREVTTAIPAPGEFHKLFKEALTESESVIFISVTSKASGLYNTAKMVANRFFKNDDITVIDSKSASFAHALLVQEAVKMVRDGKEKEIIVERLRYLANYTHAIPLLDSLKYIYRTGRIKLYQRVLGGLLGVKPLIRIDKEGSSIDGKIKGQKNSLVHLKMCGLQIQDHLLVNRMYVGYTTNKDLADEVYQFLIENGRGEVEVRIGQLGSVVGVHGGNDVVGFGFIGKYHPDMYNKLEGGTPLSTKKENLFSQKTKG
jgi:DegV family protein with EDD domain